VYWSPRALASPFDQSGGLVHRWDERLRLTLAGSPTLWRTSMPCPAPRKSDRLSWGALRWSLKSAGFFGVVSLLGAVHSNPVASARNCRGHFYPRGAANHLRCSRARAGGSRIARWEPSVKPFDGCRFPTGVSCRRQEKRENTWPDV